MVKLDVLTLLILISYCSLSNLYIYDVLLSAMITKN